MFNFDPFEANHIPSGDGQSALEQLRDDFNENILPEISEDFRVEVGERIVNRLVEQVLSEHSVNDPLLPGDVKTLYMASLRMASQLGEFPWSDDEINAIVEFVFYVEAGVVELEDAALQILPDTATDLRYNTIDEIPSMDAE